MVISFKETSYQAYWFMVEEEGNQSSTSICTTSTKLATCLHIYHRGEQGDQQTSLVRYQTNLCMEFGREQPVTQ